jgi:hypothetical protein
VITVRNSHPKGILGKEETGTMSGRKREEWNNDIRKMFPHILSCQKKKKKKEGDPLSMRDMLSPSFMSWGIEAQKEKNDLPCLGDCCSKTQPRAQTLNVREFCFPVNMPPFRRGNGGRMSRACPCGWKGTNAPHRLSSHSLLCTVMEEESWQG